MKKLMFLLVGISLLGITSQSFGQTSQTEPKTVPGYQQYDKINKALDKLQVPGRVKDVQWSLDGRFFNFVVGDEKKHYLFANGKIAEGHHDGETIAPRIFSPRGRWDMNIGRAKQADREESPDGKWIAVYSENNVSIQSRDKPESKLVVTRDGTSKRRFGTGCWVYGEELYQSRAMWWSLDSSKLVYYEMNEAHMRDYYLTLNNAVDPLKKDANLYTELLTVRYPVAGQPNPIVALHVYDLKTRTSKRIPIEGPADQYLYNIRMTPDGNSMLVNRTNRRQNKLDVIAVNLADLSSQVVVTETQETWQDNRPVMHFLEDNNRFVWETEKTLWKHYELRDLSGKRINKLTDHGDFPVNQILRIDEKAGVVYFSAFSDQQNPLNLHLHRVKLDGTGHIRLTRRNLNHTQFFISPNGKWFVTTFEAVDRAPVSALYDAEGNEVAVLASGNDDLAWSLNLSKPELFQFIAADGKTRIYGVLHKPANFNPKRKYPLVIDVYGGPESKGPENVYLPANPNCEFGYVIAKIGNRGTTHRGKAFESANYQGLGGVDIQDQADGVKFLRKRAYVDGKRVGIYGHSYGGYMSALAVLKYPDIFYCAVSGAPVTDWKNYDSIYTERYMRTPDENESGYREGSCLNYVHNLRGKLLLIHGLADDNVHPSNTWQLVQAFHNADKRFDLQVFPNNAHRIRGPYNAIRWEYFNKHLSPKIIIVDELGVGSVIE